VGVFRLVRRVGVLAVVLVLGLAAWAFWIEPSRLIIIHERLVLPGFGARELRVAVMSDIHAGAPFIDASKLRTIVDRTNAEHPDLICLLGDYVIQGVRGGHFMEPEAMAREIAGLHAAAGVFAVLGNHDGWFNAPRVAAALSHAGIRVLQDEAVLVTTSNGAVWLAGITDVATGRHDVAAALSRVTDADTPVIAMTHNPDLFPEMPARVSLTLAGHTHGGQVRLPLIGAPIVPSLYGRRYAAGHIVEGGRHLFVTTGIGTSILPVRFGVPPSIAILTLTGQPADR